MMSEKMLIPLIIEIVLLIALIFTTNVFLKKTLILVKTRLMNRGKYILSSLLQAIVLPLKTLLWIFFVIYLLKIVFIYFELDHPFTWKENFLPRIAILFCSAWFLLSWKKFTFINYREQAQKKKLANFHHIDALDKLVSIFIVFVFLMLFLDLTGQNIGTLLTIGGIGAAAIGLAAKELVTNCFGGFMIYLNSPFYIGDTIELSGKGIKGKVEEISWYITKIRDEEKQSLFVPNALFFQFIVINLSRRTHRRFKENVFFKMDNLLKFPELLSDLKQYIVNHPKYDESENYYLNFTHASENFLQITFSFYSKMMNASEYNDIREKLLLKVYNILEANGAQITSDLSYANYKKS